jgi:N-acetylmuramoyl-L-alanine amidase
MSAHYGEAKPVGQVSSPPRNPQQACFEDKLAQNTPVFEGRFGLLISLGIVVTVGCQDTPKRPTELILESVPAHPDLEVAPPLPLEAGATAPSAKVWANSGRREDGASPNRPDRWTRAWVPLASWCALNQLTLSTLADAGTEMGFRIQTARGPFDVRTGTRQADCLGVRCWLGFAPKLVQGVPCIHSLDAEKNLQPLLRTDARLLFPNRTVVVDAGHGGKDVGTKSVLGKFYEKDYTLDWALKVGRLLESKGWKVIWTRTNDSEVALSDRVAVAESAQADLFLSLHFNAGPSRDGLAGIETYCLTPTGMPSTLVRYERDDPASLFPNNAFDAFNVRLAFRMQQSLLLATDATDRGVRRARFMTVLQGQHRPALLIEGGFLSDRKEALKIADPAYRKRLAQGVVTAVGN